MLRFGLLLALLFVMRSAPDASAARSASFLDSPVPPLEELSPQDWERIRAQLHQEDNELRKMSPADGSSGDHFGESIALSRDTLIISAWQDEPSALLDGTGAIYIFERNQGGVNNWGQVKKIFASDMDANLGFGFSLALYEDTLVVGAPLDDDNGRDSGSVYVFERDAGGANNWGEVKKLLPPDGNTDDQFGRSVAISSSTIVVGAWLDDHLPDDQLDPPLNYGAVYVFERDEGGSGNWGLASKLISSDATQRDQFGGTVGISVDTIVVSAIGDDDRGDSAGAIYLFDRDLTNFNEWHEVKKIRASDGTVNDQFGYSVDISSDTIVVGAPGSDSRGLDAGAVYFYGRHHGGPNNWGALIKRTALDAATGNFFGAKVSLSRDTVIVGSPGYSFSRGLAYVLERNLGGVNNWGEMIRLSAPDAAAQDFFGYAVKVDLDTVIIGAYANDDQGFDSGSAYTTELVRELIYYMPIGRR